MSRKRQSKTGTLTDAILGYLTMIGWLVWRTNTVGIWDPVKLIYRRNVRQRTGIPDILGIDWNGRATGIEAKVGEDRLSVDQTIFAVEFIARNGFYCIAKNIDDVIKTLRYYTYNIAENGNVITRTTMGLTTKVINYDAIHNIPNANLIARLNDEHRGKISEEASNKMAALTIKKYLGKYSEKVL